MIPDLAILIGLIVGMVGILLSRPWSLMGKWYYIAHFLTGIGFVLIVAILMKIAYGAWLCQLIQ